MQNGTNRQSTSDTYPVRKNTPDCDKKIEDFFYDTFYLPFGMTSLPREILNTPYYRKFFFNLGREEGDFCFEAYDATTNEIVGIVWSRLIPYDSERDYKTPFLLISVLTQYRGKGIGSSLMRRILAELKCAGYTEVILSVHYQNRAIALYEKFGFSIYSSDGDCYLMAKSL